MRKEYESPQMEIEEFEILTKTVFTIAVSDGIGGGTGDTEEDF